MKPLILQQELGAPRSSELEKFSIKQVNRSYKKDRLCQGSPGKANNTTFY